MSGFVIKMKQNYVKVRWRISFYFPRDKNEGEKKLRLRETTTRRRILI